MNPEVLTAKKWYRWLWLSPLLTIPTFVFCFVFFTEPVLGLVCDRNSRNCDYYLAGSVIGILGSGLWHLILLVPALNQQSEFVRWHGRQALLLAGIRTAIPVAFMIHAIVKPGNVLGGLLSSIPVLIPVWFIGTLWGQRQAARGDCALMRWTGHGAGLPASAGQLSSRPLGRSGEYPMNPEVLTAKKWYRWLWLSPLLTYPTSSFLAWLGNELICGPNWQRTKCDDYALAGLVSGVIATLGCLWHLILLVPALNKQSEFVRWHGRQALLLAGIRTAIPVAFLIYSFVGGALGWLWSTSVLIAVWLFGTLWGQRQAARGDCALMRWTGHGAGLPLPTGTAKPAAAPSLGPLIHGPLMPVHRAAYYRGLSLREQGKPDEAARVLYTLLVSDATPELKARVAQELTQISGIDENVAPDVLVAIFRFSRDREQQRMVLATLNLLGLVEAL